MMHAALDMAVGILAQAAPSPVPNPGTGAPPPNSGGVLTLLKWAVNIGLAVGVFGMIATGAQMANASRRGEGGEHAAKLGWVFGGCMIMAGASGLITAVI